MFAITGNKGDPIDIFRVQLEACSLYRQLNVSFNILSWCLVCSINPQTANETLSVRTLVNMFTTGWIEQQVKFFFENRDLPYQWVEKNALNQCFIVITRYSQLSFRVEVIQRGWLKTQNIPNQKKKKWWCMHFINIFEIIKNKHEIHIRIQLKC